MWKVLICDDEKDFREQTMLYLKRYSNESGEKFSVAAVKSGEELLDRIDGSEDFLLLDIHMKTLSGMNAARALRQKGNEVPIVFISSMPEFALEGYEVHAFGFLKKPLHYRQLAWQLDDLLAMLKKQRGVSIVVQDGSSLHSFSSGEIAWAEVMGHDVQLHLVGGRTQRCSTPLSDLESKLSTAGFFRVHKSFLVNMSQVRSADLTSIELIDGSKVPLSKHRRQDFLFAFAEYKGIV